MTDAVRALADCFFAAIEAGDVEGALACYAPDARIWHNSDDLEQDVAANGRTLAGLVAITTSRRYEHRRLSVLPDGFVQQHVLVAVRPDRPTLRLAACFFCAVADRRITRLDEYFDSRALDVWR